MAGVRPTLAGSDDDSGDHDKEDDVDSQTEIDRDDEADPLPRASHPTRFGLVIVQFSLG